MKKIIIGLSIMVSFTASALDSWSAYMIDSRTNEVIEVATLNLLEDGNAELVNFNNLKATCSITDGKGAVLVYPILEADLIAHCRDSEGDKTTIALEKVKENKMHGILMEDIGNPLYFVKKK